VFKATAEVAWRDGRYPWERIVRTFWWAKERPQGFRVMGGGILYVEDVKGLETRPAFPIDLFEKSGFKSGYEFVPRHSEGELCVILVLPPGKAANFGFCPEDAKITDGRLAVYWKLKKKSPEAVVIAWTVREPHGSLQDEERKITHRSSWRRLVKLVPSLETQRLIIGGIERSYKLLYTALIVILAGVALYQGAPAMKVLIAVLEKHLPSGGGEKRVDQIPE
jgi:hypothetical protein